MSLPRHPFVDRVAVLGHPDSQVRFRSHTPAPWSAATLRRLVDLGFTAVQLNLAWGARPDDEPLNLEDLVEPSPAVAAVAPQVAAPNCRPGPAAREQRRELIRHRLALARAAGLRTLFHFGAPYNRHAHYGDTPPNCICDPALGARYRDLIARFAADFPGVDDLLVYTYDQDAWLCGEFGGCPRCNGVPLHERLPPFLAILCDAWRAHHPAGRLWWEPWELSAGQIHACIERLPVAGLGLALHANIAECMAGEAADPWFIATARQAAARGLPVWAEWFLGGQSEETEPLRGLAHPLTIRRGLARLAAVSGVTGLKEYCGLLPDRADDDANLQTTALILRRPDVTDDQLLEHLAQPYGPAAGHLQQAWRLASEAMERHPWDCSWLGRQIGRARTDHALSAAILRPMLCPTPSWRSSRGSVFLRTEATPADPWLLEDVGLRCEQAATLNGQALEALALALPLSPDRRRPGLEQWHRSLAALRRRQVAYACHLRATLVAIAARERLRRGLAIADASRDEMHRLLTRSHDNHAEECQATGADPIWEECDRALTSLGDTDYPDWLGRWLQPAEDQQSKGYFSLTSC